MELSRLPCDLNVGVGTFRRDPMDFLAFFIALKTGHADIPAKFIMNSSDLLNYDLKVIRMLRQNGINIHIRGPSSPSILQRMTKLQLLPVMYDYIESLASETLPIESLVTVLYYACECDSPELLEILRSRSETVDDFSEALATAKGYENLLTYSVAHGSLRMIKKLISMGFEIDRVAGGSVTAISVAQWYGKQEILDYLNRVGGTRVLPDFA